MGGSDEIRCASPHFLERTSFHDGGSAVIRAYDVELRVRVSGLLIDRVDANTDEWDRYFTVY